MKIIDTEDEVLKVYDDGNDIWLEFEDRGYAFTPLEAQYLCEMLTNIVNNTEYFKGLKGAGA